ncbi:MAG: TetR/AcrR family transcriptional regulator [Chloroflexi bacterium]|nr:TetR/AcrR family transcriptional regulator [Chloroflexota bacterium]
MSKVDPRVRRTDKLLQEALVELAAERGFDAITVGDIAERADVNRATFYRHYQDKYDLLDQIFAQAVEQFTSTLGPPGQVVQNIDPRNPPERWVRLFEHFREHERLYATLLGRKGSSWFSAKVRDHFTKLLEEREQQRARLQSFRGKPMRSQVPRKVAMTLMSNMLISTVAWWLESGQAYSPGQMVSWFLDLAINGYVRVLGL